jgi:DNA-binding MarR family transcriptional regulator
MADEQPRIPLAPLLELVGEIGLRQLHEGFDEAGYPGMRKAHGAVWRFVDLERGSRLTELAERAGLSRQAVGEIADDLERLGYVERVPDPSDGRAKLIRPTERGRVAWERGVEILADIERGWAERYGERRVAMLRETLERILEGEPPGPRRA